VSYSPTDQYRGLAACSSGFETCDGLRRESFSPSSITRHRGLALCICGAPRQVGSAIPLDIA
jgi:hypothetical protein